MEFEWKKLEIPLSYAVERHYIKHKYDGEYEERTLTSGPAKGGAFVGSGTYYELSLYFNDIPQFLKTCYVRNVGFIYGEDNNTIVTVNYKQDDTGVHEIGRSSTVVSTAVGCKVFTADINLFASDSGSFGDVYEDKLQTILANDNIKEFIGLKANYISDTYFNYNRNEFEDVSKIKLVFDYAEAPVEVVPIYPIDVYLKKTKPLEISWTSRIKVYREGDYSSARYKKSDELLYINQTKIELWNDLGLRTEHIIPGAANVYSISSEELSYFDVGNLYYKITVSTNAGVSEYSESTCIVTGETDAPNIISHTNNSFPVISWECVNQSAWQMIVKQGEVVFFDTGINPGNAQEYKLPILLDDGNYSIEMRAINTYGFYTAWSSYLMILNTVKPSAPSGIIVSANNKFGINVKCNIPDDAGKLYVMRRKDSLSKAEIIGEYKDNFVYYNVPLNEYYEYTVKNYVEGTADGEWVDAAVMFNGIVVRKDNDFVTVHMSENEFDVINSNEKMSTLTHCVGRTYPILEISEWISSIRRVSGCVSNEEYELLVAMSLKNNVMLQNNKEAIPCYMSIADNGKHVSGNRLIDLTFTRIDGE